MAVFTNIDIKKRRELLKMTAAELAEKVGCDPTTIYNYESGKCDPSPDMVYMIAEALGDFNAWYDWMRTKYWSYAKMHPESHAMKLPEAMMSMYAEIGDLLDLQREAMRDASTGDVDDPGMRAKLEKEASEALGACQRFLNVLKSANMKQR